MIEYLEYIFVSSRIIYQSALSLASGSPNTICTRHVLYYPTLCPEQYLIWLLSVLAHCSFLNDTCLHILNMSYSFICLTQVHPYPDVCLTNTRCNLLLCEESPYVLL